MKKDNYLSRLQGLLDSAYPELAGGCRLEFKNCFGAVAAYLDGNIFISCGRFGIALKLPSRILKDIFKEPGVTHLKYFAKGHVKKEYAVLPSHILNDQSRLRNLLDESIKYVLAGPP